MLGAMNRPALVFVALGIAVLAGLFLLLRPEPEPLPPAPPAAAGVPDAPAPVLEAVLPAPLVTAWTVKDGKRQTGPVRLIVKAGEEIVLRVTSDRDDELHLHGYDLSLPLAAGEPAELRFRAEHSGRFEAELHRSHLELATLEVMPQ